MCIKLCIEPVLGVVTVLVAGDPLSIHPALTGWNRKREREREYYTLMSPVCPRLQVAQVQPRARALQDKYVHLSSATGLDAGAAWPSPGTS